MRHTIARTLRVAALLLLAGAGARPAAAAGITVEPLLRQRTVTSLVACDGIVAGGLDGGGVAVWAPGNPGEPAFWTAGADLSGNYVTCLAWTGRHLWVGTTGAGLTRVANPGGAPDFRQYAGNLAGLDISAVAGAVVGDAERVWYAAAGVGVGVITNGIAGATYTAERDGLVSNSIDAIAIQGDAVFFAGAAGVSRFAGNVFTDAVTGLNNTDINALGLAPDGMLHAVGEGGLYAWDPGTATWSLIGTTGYGLDRLAWVGGTLWVMGLNGSGAAVASAWDGAVFTPLSAPRASAAALAGGDRLWIGGRHRLADMGSASGHAWYAVLDGAGTGWTTTVLDAGPVVGDVEGVTFGADGRAWIGSRIAQGFCGVLDGQWSNVYELATADNDSNGMINHSGNLLAMATDSEGMIWATQYGSGGLLRHDPTAGRTEQVLVANSGLAGRGVVQLAAHPAGPLLVMHDWQDAVKVEVLVDPAHWRSDANWVALPSGAGGLGDGPTVWDAYVERNDVIWFAVEETGLVRWDVNGDALGPDDTLTWTDPSDDRWDEPVTAFPGLDNNPRRAQALAAGPDGSIWCGGDGLVRFRYDAEYRYLTVEDYLLVKQSPVAEGLLGGGVYDLAVGRGGDLWVACLNGLNRVRMVDGEPVVEAWLDLMNYVGGTGYSTLYSPAVIDALPGFIYRKLAADPGSGRVLLSGDRGAALVTPTDGGASGGADPLAALYLNQNPWNPDLEPELAIGGIGASTAEPADVTIFTVEGNLVYRDDRVVAGRGFWNGNNPTGSPVVTGLYVVKVAWDGASAVRTLAIVR